MVKTRNIYIIFIYFSFCYLLGIHSIFKDDNGGAHNTKNTDMSWLYQNQNQKDTCHLSSSILYGGQDIYPQTQSSQNASFNSLVSHNTFNNLFNL